MTVSTGPMLDDALVSSPVIVGEDGGGVAPVSMADYEFGIDPNEDPELVLVSVYNVCWARNFHKKNPSVKDMY